MSSLPSIPALEINRRFKATRQAVFDAFSSFEGIKPWFGPGPCHVTGGFVNFKVGGGYRIEIQTPDRLAVVVGRYTVIQPPEKLAFTWKWADDEDWTEMESQVVIEFQAIGSETELRLRQTGFPSEESRGNHSHGWLGCLEKLSGRF